MSKARKRQKFSYLDSGGSYPYIDNLCHFENTSNIYCGKDVKFLRGCCVMANNNGRVLIGNGSSICRFSIVQSVGGTIMIGENTCIGDFCSLYGQGGLTIGNNVAIASCVQIVPNQHTFEDPLLPISVQPCKSIGIYIEDDCWIGTNVVILDGVTIGKGAIVGAGSVVTRNVAAYTIVAGVPARLLHLRHGH